MKFKNIKNILIKAIIFTLLLLTTSVFAQRQLPVYNVAAGNLTQTGAGANYVDVRINYSDGTARTDGTTIDNTCVLLYFNTDDNIGYELPITQLTTSSISNPVVRVNITGYPALNGAITGQGVIYKKNSVRHVAPYVSNAVGSLQQLIQSTVTRDLDALLLAATEVSSYIGTNGTAPAFTPATGEPRIAKPISGNELYLYNGSTWSLPSGGGSTETASNGLTKTGNDIKLGGALTGGTVITGGNTNAFAVRNLANGEISATQGTTSGTLYVDTTTASLSLALALNTKGGEMRIKADSMYMMQGASGSNHGISASQNGVYLIGVTNANNVSTDSIMTMDTNGKIKKRNANTIPIQDNPSGQAYFVEQPPLRSANASNSDSVLVVNYATGVIKAQKTSDLIGFTDVAGNSVTTETNVNRNGTIGVRSTDTTSQLNLDARGTVKKGIEIKSDSNNVYFKITPTVAVDPVVPSFSILSQNYANINAPYSTKGNHVYRMGTNLNSTGGRINATEPSMFLAFENRYHSPQVSQGTAYDRGVTELHIGMLDTLGGEHRNITMVNNRAGAPFGYSQTELKQNRLNFKLFNDASKMSYDLLTNVITYDTMTATYHLTHRYGISPINLIDPIGGALRRTFMYDTVAGGTHFVLSADQLPIYIPTTTLDFRTDMNFRVLDGGSMFFGTTAKPSPSFFTAPNDDVIDLFNKNVATHWKIRVSNAGLNFRRESGSYDSPLTIWTTATQDNIVLRNGNVGINKANPAYKLHVDAKTGSGGNPLLLEGLTSTSAADSALVYSTSASGAIPQRISILELLSGTSALSANPTTGTTIGYTTGTTHLRVSSNATIAALTITFPSSPVNNQTYNINFIGQTNGTAQVTTLSFIGGTINTASLPVTSVNSGDTLRYIYDSGTSTWIRVVL